MWLKLDTSAQVNDETALLFMIYILLLLVSFQGWDFSLNFNVCAVSNLSAFLPGTLLLYRQFILPSSNALFLLTAGGTEVGSRGSWRTWEAAQSGACT